LKLLLIGCGSIGTVIAKAADAMDAIEEIILYDSDHGRAKQLQSKLSKSRLIEHLDFNTTTADIAIEAASQKAAKEYIPPALEAGMDALIMSVGTFVDSQFQERCFTAASSKDRFVLIPSGAIAGVDALKGASKAEIEKVMLTSTKPPKGFTGVKYLVEKGIQVEEIREKTMLYSGPAGQAVQLFPANVNVAATVSLAGIGFEKTIVEIICDPASNVNSHRLYAKGAFGELETITRNLPSPDNPRTSYLASLSAVSTLNSYIRNVWIGV